MSICNDVILCSLIILLMVSCVIPGEDRNEREKNENLEIVPMSSKVDSIACTHIYYVSDTNWVKLETFAKEVISKCDKQRRVVAFYCNKQKTPFIGKYHSLHVKSGSAFDYLIAKYYYSLEKKEFYFIKKPSEYTMCY